MSDVTDENVVVHYLVMHRHAPLLWMGWLAACCAVTTFTLFNGPIVTYVNAFGPEAVVPLSMTVVAGVWGLIGASVGWMPRP